MTMNSLDRAIAWLDPIRANRRAAARAVLAYYEAAKPSKQRKFRTDRRSPNIQVEEGAEALRDQARHLHQNHDIARGALRTLVNNTIGPNGIGVEFQPRGKDGKVHHEYATLLNNAYRDWCRKPEVTHCMTWPKAQRMLATHWYRDGEAFAQHLMGPIGNLDHGTRVPYSLELLAPDLVPMHYNEGTAVRQGIGRNVWGKKISYYVYKSHPGDNMRPVGVDDLKQIPADRMMHLAAIDNIGQLRGVSEFASVLGRLEDIKDYEESERIAAKIAARLTAYIKKGDPAVYDQALIPASQKDADGNPIPRDMALQAGTIIDDLMPGEEVGMVDSSRPNPNLFVFRQGQLRAVAAGFGTTYSSTAKDYNGTWSAQRQELVEQWVNYAVLTDDFVSMVMAPVIERFIAVADASGVARMPSDVDPETVIDALYIAQAMPWIDPIKEADAWKTLVRAGFASEIEVIRRRGGNPRDTMDQMAKFRKDAKEKNLVFDSDPANDQQGGQPAGPAAKPASNA